MSYEDIEKYVKQNNNNKEKDKNKLKPAKKTNLEKLEESMGEGNDEHRRNSTLSGNGGNGFDIAPMIDDGRDVR